MPRNKDLKRIIRTRMKKTGESYTAARAHIINRRRPARPSAPTQPLAQLAGMSDEAIAAKTGRSWREWLRLLDADNAVALPHRRIAALLKEKHAAPDWWAQMIAVGYERIKKLRERGQQRDGTYEASKSRTFDVAVRTLFDAWADDATRRKWLRGVNTVVRTATAPKAMRLQWPDGTIVAIGFTAKNGGRSAVAVQHTKLRDRAAATQVKQDWADRFDALAATLGIAKR